RRVRLHQPFQEIANYGCARCYVGGKPYSIRAARDRVDVGPISLVERVVVLAQEVLVAHEAQRRIDVVRTIASTVAREDVDLELPICGALQVAGPKATCVLGREPQ